MKLSLKKIEEEVRSCEKCDLCKTRTKAVPGFGDFNAEIMFVGEAPGRNEDLKGEPFVGAAGKVLDGLLESIELNRENIFITNIVKCRPPKNRDPLPEEVYNCSNYLEKQVELIKPKIIVLLGRHAMDRFLPNLKISLDHGKVKQKDGKVYFPIYHPAATIYRREFLKYLQDDFKKIPKIIKLIKEEKEIIDL